MATKNYFMSGITELLLLYFLNQKDCYVYEITKAISELSEGYLSISQNTIYTATYKLENEGLISEYSKLVGRKRTRVYYHIEPAGIESLQSLMNIYTSTFKGIESILSKKLSPDPVDELNIDTEQTEYPDLPLSFEPV